MKNSSFVPFIELHSDDVSEMLRKPPHWMLLWGISFLFFFLVVIVCGTYFIRYPDLVVAPVALSSQNPPRKVVAKVEGKLARLLVSNGESVRKGQIIAFSESIGNPEQILELEATTQRMHNAAMHNDWNTLLQENISTYAGLGELQTNFETFHQNLVELNSFQKGGFFQEKKKLLMDDQHDLLSLGRVLSEQQQLQNRDLELAKDEFQIQETLYKTKVIAALEFKKERARLLARELPLKLLESSLIQNNASRTAKQKELLELENQATERTIKFKQALYSLRSQIATWKQRYLLVAPVDGRISFQKPLQEQQHLNVGEELLSVEPVSTAFQGFVRVPQTNIGKVKVGQLVQIKLDAYPYREYGVVLGRLTQLSPLPGKDSTYWGFVTLPNGLNTVFGNQVAYRDGLLGTAEIVTVERRLLSRLLDVISFGGAPNLKNQ